MATQPWYQDFNADIGPGAGASSSTVPGSGLTSNNSLAPGSVSGDVTGQASGLNDLLGQFTEGGAQQGSLGERLSMAAKAGFADPTLGNIARAIMTGLSIASPMGPFDIAAGEAIQGLHLPGYASPIMNIVGQLPALGGLPTISPHALPTFTGFGNFPPELINALATATTPQQIQAIQAQLQAYASAHGGGGSEGHNFATGGPAGDITAGVGAAIPGAENPGSVALNALRDAINSGAGGNSGQSGSSGGGIGGGPGGSHASVAGF